MNSSIDQKSGESSPAHWVRVSDEVLAGKGMEEYNSEAMGQFIDWVEREDSVSMHAVPYMGQFLVDVVETDGNAVHLPNFPADEFIFIITGSLTLTADSTKIDQNFGAGDRVLIPKGWAGVWRVHRGLYREVAIVPGNYFDISGQLEAAPKGASAFGVPNPTTSGIRNIFDGAFSVEANSLAQEETRALDMAADEVIQIVGGTLALKGNGKAETFKVGDIVIVPKGFKGELQASAGYKALVARGK